MRAPIWFVYGNCVFGSGPEDAWAGFAIDTSSYAWLSEEGKRSRFADLLGAIERGEPLPITRGHHPVAEIGPARRRTGADLRAALADISPPDDRFADNIADALSLVTPEERDPWADA